MSERQWGDAEAALVWGIGVAAAANGQEGVGLALLAWAEECRAEARTGTTARRAGRTAWPALVARPLALRWATEEVDMVDGCGGERCNAGSGAGRGRT